MKDYVTNVFFSCRLAQTHDVSLVRQDSSERWDQMHNQGDKQMR